MKKKLIRDGKSGFTMIELLISTVLIGVLLSSLYLSFQSALLGYRKTEEHLMNHREGEIFLGQLEHELRNSIPFYQLKNERHFIGKIDSLAFPSVVRRYTTSGYDEDLYYIHYRLEGRTLTRTELKMRPKFKGRKTEKESLFENLDECRFEYLYLDKNDKLSWQKEWKNEPYYGLPRGVRITVSGSGFNEKQVYEILIPHGTLLKLK